MKQPAEAAERVAADEGLKVERASIDAATMRVKLQEVEAGVQASVGLGTLDQMLAEQLFGYASNDEMLRTLGQYFPYEIPHGPVRLIEKLSALPMTRAPHDDELAGHFKALTDGAQLWLSKFLPLVSTRGDYFTTRLDYDVSEEAYKQHSASTDALGDAGFDLHKKMLAYQRYYASL